MAKDTGEKEEEIAPGQEVDFCTLGMFIVGESPLFSLFTKTSECFQCVVRGLPAKLWVHKTGSILCILKKYLKDKALYSCLLSSGLSGFAPRVGVN